MSHFSEVKTQLKSKPLLKKALTSLGYKVSEGIGADVRGFFGETQKADFKISTSSDYDIGFKKNQSGHYELVGDWDLLPKVSGINQQQFLNSVSRAYATTAIQEVAKEKGYDLEINVDQEEQTTEIVVRQW